MKRSNFAVEVPARVLFVLVLLFFANGTALALDNGRGHTPAMGWNAWNTFGCSVSEKLIKDIARTMVSSGLRDAGYKYLVLDDCWMGGRDEHGNLIANRTRFPSGMKALGAFIHSKGLLFGIYESPNTVTCAVIWSGYPAKLGTGSADHNQQDAKTFASWGVDYLKYDHCRGDYDSFARMRDALRAAGRPILYSINPEFGQVARSRELPFLANSARVGDDIFPKWQAVTRLIDEGSAYAMLSKPGYFNDLDMLEVGNGMSQAEDRAHFAMWAVLASPLLAGNDIRSMSPQTKAILENRELIAVDQDPLGVQATLADEPSSTTQIWSRPLAGKRTYAIVLLNRGDRAVTIDVPWNWHVGFQGPARVRDLWTHKDLGVFDTGYSAVVQPHDAAAIKVTVVTGRRAHAAATAPHRLVRAPKTLHPAVPPA
ncbi:MAG TPA: glycoside hydrolase family 27 protein [Candidatus Baltobacteraceae bacterium]|nr:glycoside hydrolase family 27 protein [Candidatus Baltobacteraceae bacterium]